MFEAGSGWWMFAVLVPAMLFAGWNDYRTHRVPNWLNVLLASGGLAAHTWLAGWAGLWHATTGMLVGFGLLVGLWLIRGMGAGDVKFMAALGAWLGPQLTLYAVAAAGLIGGVIALGMIAARGRWRQSAFNVGVLMTKCSSVRTALSDFGSAGQLAGQAGMMPYAIPLSLGTTVVILARFSGWWGVL